ncbi:hypothetical protein AMAG_04731 [Allomyces macrogynus ATCC 38327]|uniref:SAM-dependent MTase RsmB/NOP-type domain-containing protein n=1 Tax=Allomyces macrogynus (strain ATCC 38327) TaxID=578462 RepID=A0A0L0S643_ALLM3|nr:hypothetical protein AMAG_04731 [Allomyces macrogynus ATCC 38327]|eukprot:KNE57886.1 hypothetical protein AMAG_04731 [Allomyces macrogynus ATCC 38327]
MARHHKKRSERKARAEKPVERKPASSYAAIDYNNANFEAYYKAQGILSEAEWDTFMTSLKSQLPTTFRFTGSRSYAKHLAENSQRKFFPSLQNIEVDGVKIAPPTQIPWYPEGLAYQYDASRTAIRKSPALKRFHQFLTSESEIGNISRQEAVSMIPPLLLDVQPHHHVLDMCAAPGSKTAQLIEAVDATDVEGQLPDGLVVANDADGKRAYMLVHQTKRLQTPCLLITNHAAQMFPSLHDPATGQQLKFDRILADVPCSGDGTMRKNPLIWRSWTPNEGSALHFLQLRILMRAIALTKVGGKLVYSTCSMNPIENEAVVAAALKRCGGAVRLVDASKMLPELLRRPGVKTWTVPSYKAKEATFYSQFSEVPNEDKARITPSYFPPTDIDALNIERCLRIYPHLQNTGGFFVALLEKVAEPVFAEGANQYGELPEDQQVRRQKGPKGPHNPRNRRDKDPVVDTMPEDEGDAEMEEATSDDVAAAAKVVDQAAEETTTQKRKAEEDVDSDEAAPRKQIKLDSPDADAAESSATATPAEPATKTDATDGPEMHKNRKHYEEPFVFLSSADGEYQTIKDVYGFPDSFPASQLVVRSEAAAHRAIYLCSSAVKQMLLAKGAYRLKVVNTGVRLFSRIHDQSALATCTHRFNDDGLALIAPMLTKRVIQLDRATVTALLLEDRPLIATLPSEKVTNELKALAVGGAVAKFQDEKDPALTIWIPLWRAPVSVGLLVNKKERVSMMHRLDIPLPVEEAKEAPAKAEGEVEEVETKVVA